MCQEDQRQYGMHLFGQDCKECVKETKDSTECICLGWGVCVE